MLTARAQSGRRALEPAGLVERHTERPSENGAAFLHWREGLIRGQRKVIERYRELLATCDMPQAERTSIENRIAVVETEIADLQETPNRSQQATVKTQQAA
jgi:hypothetical protein